MAMNPMQRKANNYLLIGVLVTLLITGTIIGFLFMQLNNLQTEMNKEKATAVDVYVTSQDIKSGETVTMDKLIMKKVSSNVVSANTSLSLSEETVSKINLAAGTIVTNDMIAESSEVTTNDLRNQEYNMVILPSQIQSGDYIDIRLKMSNGTDFIVVSKKKIEIPEVEGVESADTIVLKMNEAETLIMNNAIIEAYIDKGSMLYATTYVEAGLQTDMIPTYVPSGIVQNALHKNPNIEQEAKDALFSRYNANTDIRTNFIDGALAQYNQERVDSIEAGVQAQITKAKQAREAYLQSLGGY